MSETKRTTYNMVVGVKDGEIYLLNGIFDHGNGFKGATGSILRPVTADEVEERRDLEYVKDVYGYLWQEAVADGSTEISLNEYIEDIIFYCDGHFPGHDDSDIEHLDDDFISTYFPDAETFECVGGGRCFSTNMKFDVLVSQDLLDIIELYENKPVEKLKAVK